MFDAHGRFRAFLDGLPGDHLRELARAYAARSARAGVYVLKPDAERVPIPPILTPARVPAARRAQVSEDARLILSGLHRLTAALMTDPRHDGLRQRLFGSFTPLEAEGLRTCWREAEHLATARVDYLVDVAGRPRALEVNTTIPAMQGYSDCIAEAFLREVGRARGLDAGRIDRLVEDNGRNTDDLLDALVAHDRRLGGDRPDSLTIAIVARAGDAQLGELEHYTRRWAERGHTAFITTPDRVRPGDGGARADGRPVDLIYRHVFIRRLDPREPFARMCLEPARWRIWNPISSHLEVKGLLALLSAAAGEGAWARLPDDVGDAVTRAVPWTRLFHPGPARGPDGEAIPELVRWTRASAERLVLKRSWDYGGKSVFLGAELPEPASQARLRALLGDQAPPGEIGWDALVDFALSDGDAWVVQELIAAEREVHLRVEPEGPAWRALYADLSAYTCSTVPVHPRGGAVRASESRIVNILGGGGLAPLVREEVLAALLA